MIRLETKLQEILHKYETEARKQHGDFKRQHADLPPQATPLLLELDSLRLVLDGKDKEITMLHEKLRSAVLCSSLVACVIIRLFCFNLYD